ncbi:MAG: ParA family protein [Gammaproteobacteria bacterium]|nr:MAG: ParA family protein [Gammaproteobacteria bacterium]
MSKVFVIANQKGGVGKTTTSINLAAALSKTRRRILLIDLDPQGNSTAGSGIDKDEVTGTIYELLIGLRQAPEVILSTESGFDIIPANKSLSGAQVELLDMDRREYLLRKALADIRNQYDFVFIDCPPALNILTLNAFVAADSVMIPMQCEYFALEGLTDLVGTIKRIRETLNPDLIIEGLLRTMFDQRNNLAREVSDQLTTHFGDKVYRTIIPRNIRLAEAPSYGKPITEYDITSKGAQAYLALAGEIIRRDQAA